MKEDMSLSNLGTVAFHAAKVPTNVFSSTLICLSTIDYMTFEYNEPPRFCFKSDEEPIWKKRLKTRPRCPYLYIEEST